MTHTPPGRPPPTDPPSSDLGVVARHAFRTAGLLRGLAELLAAAEWKPDGHSLSDLTGMADTINGLSVRLAIGSADAQVLSEVTGRTFVQISADPAEWARLAQQLGAGHPDQPEQPEQPGGGEGPDDWRHALDDWRPDSPWSPEQWAAETRALRSALAAIGVTMPHCLPGEPDDCGTPLWSHYATYAAMLRAFAHAMTEINLGTETVGGRFAEDVYHAELGKALEDAGVLPDSTADLDGMDGPDDGEDGPAR